MKKNIIYRVENNLGEGCYSQGAMTKNGLESHDSSSNTPHPIYDFGIDRYPNADEKCAFASKKQLNAWFTKKELTRMAENGYFVKKMEVNEITAIGQKQILVIV